MSVDLSYESELVDDWWQILLRHCMRERGIDRQSLATLMDMSLEQINEYFSDDADPKLSEVMSLFSAIDCDLELRINDVSDR